MPSILSGFDSVQQALAAHQYALSITQRNVANASNESYTRQDPVFVDVTESGSFSVSIQAYRNRYIDYGISRESQSLGEQRAAADALQQIDAIMNETGGAGLQEALSNFFNGFNALSAAPEDAALRQQVLAKAAALTATFHRVYGAIQQVQTAQNSAIKTTADEINAISSKIAALNQKVAIAHASSSDEEFTLRDSRQQLVEQLSGLMDISYYETESGSLTVTTRQGGLLAAENQSRALEAVSPPNAAFYGIQLDGVDITSTVQSGKLGGLLKVRDVQSAGYLSNLDEIAATVISRVNEQHADGIDLDGNVGGSFFAPFVQAIPGSNAGAARSIGVAIADWRKIAASTSGGAGDGQNAKLLFAIKDEQLFSAASQTASQFYSGLIYSIGSDEAAAADGIANQTNILNQLKNQRDSQSGVNLDEEAANLIKYQKAYQASAKFANVLELLSDEILQLLGV
jgi:flagellar hook-associated protein 1